MDKKYSTKSVLVYDFGTYVSMAERLAKDFGKVRYFSPWQADFPQRKMASIGSGLEGVERVNNFWDYIEDSDCFIFPDICCGDIQVHLESLGKRIWGSRKGEELEMDRVGVKELMKGLKLPVGKYEVVKGIDDLRKYLQNNEDVFIKQNVYRGDFESFYSPNYKFVELKLNEIEYILGAQKNEVEFICEENLKDRVELGYDGFSVDGKFPSKTIFGLEIKDAAYCSVFVDALKLPKQITEFNTKISDILNVYGYRNFFSTETRVGKDKVGYTVDITPRNGRPPSELMQLEYSNFSEIIWEGSGGNLIDPIPTGKYAVEVMLKCNGEGLNWLPVTFPSKYKDNIKLANTMVVDGKHYIVPQHIELSEIGAVVTTGKTLDEAMDKVQEIADEVKSYYIEVPKQSLDKAKEEIAKLKSFGIDLF
jgi:hypothetical protein